MRGDRRGFTLIELMIACVLLLLVGSAIYKLLIRTQRASREQAERVDLQSNVRAGTLILASELREVGYDDSTRTGTFSADLLAIATDSIAFRAVRSSGIVCSITSTSVVVDTTRNYSAYRAPIALRDTLMILAEKDATTSADDAWLRRPILQVAGGTCPASFGSRKGLTLTTVITTPSNFVAGTPMRTFEPVVYKMYTSEGKRYLGTYSKTATELVQPVLGPLAANGFRLTYLDSLGNSTSTINKVRSVRITLVGLTDQGVTAGGSGTTPAQKADSLSMVVTLRNTLR